MVAKIPQGLKAKDMADKTFIRLDQDTLVADAAKTLYEKEGCSVIVPAMIAPEDTEFQSASLPKETSFFGWWLKTRAHSKLL